VCTEAARRGYREVLKWAREQGCPCDAIATRREAFEGAREQARRWMYEEGLFA